MKRTRTMAMVIVGLLSAGAVAQTTMPSAPMTVKFVRATAGPAGAGMGAGGGTVCDGPITIQDGRITIPARPDPNAFEPPKMEKAAFLGIATTSAPPVVREQLKLPRGIGLVVDMVEKDSPAAAAGLKQFDVLHKLNDQILVNAQQLAVLVRTFKPGDEIKLTAIRQGQAKEFTAKLIEKELPALDDNAMWEHAIPNVMRLHGIPGAALPPMGGVNTVIDMNGEEMRWMDDQHDIQVTTRDGKKHLIAKDRAGKVLFDGPIDTPEQKNKIPAQVRQKLDQVTTHMPPPGFKIELQPPTTQP